jgi:fatty-acid desaturase
MLFELAASAKRLLWRLIRIVVVFLPPIGVIAAMILLWGGCFGPLYLTLFGVMYLLTGFGITIGFHRLFTHAGFKTSPAVVWTLGILGSKRWRVTSSGRLPPIGGITATPTRRWIPIPPT